MPNGLYRPYKRPYAGLPLSVKEQKSNHKTDTQEIERGKV